MNYCIMLSISFSEVRTFNKGKKMPTAVRISDYLVKKARSRSRALNRSLSGQIEYWVKIGEIAEENPDLTFSFIQDILIGLEEIKNHDMSQYVFGEGQ